MGSVPSQVRSKLLTGFASDLWNWVYRLDIQVFHVEHFIFFGSISESGRSEVEEMSICGLLLKFLRFLLVH